MKEIRLSLKKKWFEMTKAGIKKEDYRDITPYWMSRILLYNGRPQNQTFWYLFLHKKNYNEIKEETTFKEFDVNTMTLGYPKRGDKERELRYEHEGIEIREGKPKWGAEKGKVYFVIKHGEEMKY